MIARSLQESSCAWCQTFQWTASWQITNQDKKLTCKTDFHAVTTICILNAVHQILISKCDFISYSQNDGCSNYTLVILSFFHGHKKFFNLVFPFRFLLLNSEPFMYMFAFLKFKHYGAHTNWFSFPLNSKQSLSSLTNIECRWRRNEPLTYTLRNSSGLFQ